MPKEPHRPVLEVEEAGLDESPPGLAHVQQYLTRFGYLNELTFMAGTLDSSTASALEQYQQHEGLEVTGNFDAQTRTQMARSRCGLPDLHEGIAFRARCAWDRRRLTYAFGPGTQDVVGDSERDAIRSAFLSWAQAVPLTFAEVPVNATPDVLVDWRNANDPDFNMTGTTLAHADFPPGCSFVTNNLPKPVHFDDSEHTWVIGAAAGSFDVETVALHEIGHIIGLEHSTVSGAVMAATVADNSILRVLQPDDVAGAQLLYPPIVSLRAFNAPDRFIRHRNFLGEISPINNDLDRRDASFMVRPGLADPTFVSLESVNFRNHFLRHQNWELKLHHRSETELFRLDATFKVNFGRADPKGISFTSLNAPTRYLRHRNFKLWLDQASTDALFARDSTFLVVDGLWQG